MYWRKQKSSKLTTILWNVFIRHSEANELKHANDAFCPVLLPGFCSGFNVRYPGDRVLWIHPQQIFKKQSQKYGKHAVWSQTMKCISLSGKEKINVGLWKAKRRDSQTRLETATKWDT